MAQRHPFHKLCYVPAGETGRQLLLATAGDTIQSLDLQHGSLLGQWPSEVIEDCSEISTEADDERPNKKRKVENGESQPLSRQGSEGSEASIEILADGKLRQKGERRKPKIPDTRLPNVSHIISTSDGKNVIAVTTEDKAVRVFKVTRKGRLKQITSRCMPKKLCAITMSKDEKTILLADKFGDVYSLPLYPTEGYTPKETPAPETFFKPAASKLTVHTQGNLEALRQQELQKHIHRRKEGPDFEHKLLLGHVSLLTDLKVAEATVEGKSRPFIITSDRDEHIRVSRGMPQSHIIETYCMGHREFVSKICVLPWESRLLVAGNGEPTLRVYDWKHGKELGAIYLAEVLKTELANTLISPERSPATLAVSGIWPIDVNDQKRLLLVGLEGLPLLFTFQLQGSELFYRHALSLDGNFLDLTVLPDQHNIILSIDDVHESASLKFYRSKQAEFDPIQQYQLFFHSGNTFESDMSWRKVSQTFGVVNVFKDFVQTHKENPGEGLKRAKMYEKTYSAVGEFVYGLENLRKKRGHAAEEEDDDASMAITEFESNLDV